MRDPLELGADDSLPAAGRRAGRATRLPACVALLLLTGCSTLGYYGQAVQGQAEILLGRRSLERAMSDPATPPAVREKLRLAADARRFAATALHLPDNSSYLRYTDLGRQFVVWNVFAAPALSLEPVESCFPVVGCLDYRGYFHEQGARDYARELANAGHDVYVGGVAAYSTLGWFADPLLDTMLAWDDRRLVTTIFHELAHQRVYVRDDTTFNESFAMAVGELGYARWRADRGEPVEADVDGERDAALVELLIRHREALAATYRREDLDDAHKLQLKRAQFAALAADYAALRAQWHGDTRYDAWMNTDMNNAKLASIATYHAFVPGFRALFGLAGADFAAFYARVDALGRLVPAARARCLEAWAAGATPRDCPGPVAAGSARKVGQSLEHLAHELEVDREHPDGPAVAHHEERRVADTEFTREPHARTVRIVDFGVQKGVDARQMSVAQEPALDLLALGAAAAVRVVFLDEGDVHIRCACREGAWCRGHRGA